jgi:hypothetical protein
MAGAVTTRRVVLRRILILEAVAFLAIVAIIWLDELLDLPHLLFRAPRTPVRLGEGLLESVLTMMVGIGVVSVTWRAFRRIQYLESLSVMCAWCRRVREGGDWLTVEAFLERQHHAQTTHGICEACAAGITMPPT